MNQQWESRPFSLSEQLHRLPTPYPHVEIVKQGDIQPDQRRHARPALAQVLDVVVQNHVRDEDFDLIYGEEPARARVLSEPEATSSQQ